MDECSRYQPRDEGCVLDGVPGPVPTPSEYLVRPQTTEHDAEREESPRHERPGTRSFEPCRTAPTYEKGCHCKRKRNGQPNVARVENRWVHCHEEVILEKRIRSKALSRSKGRCPDCPGRFDASHSTGDGAYLERIGDGQHQSKEEQGNDAHDAECTRPELTIFIAFLEASPHRPDEQRKHEAPQHDAPCEGSPGRSDLEDERRRRSGMIRHIRHREIIREKRELENRH